MTYPTQELHVDIRCDSRPWRNTSGWMTKKEAHDYAYQISEEAYSEDVARYGDSRVHVVNVYCFESRRLFASASYLG